MRDEILATIDSIDEACMESEVAVMEAMINEIEKYVIMMENYEGTDSFETFYQEASSTSVLDQVKKEGKKDSNKLITVLKFIPRLIRALVENLKKKFKDKDIGDKIKEGAKKLNKLDKQTKEAKVKEINKQLEGQAECYIDEKTGKIKFKKDPKSIIATMTWLIALTNNTCKLFERIKNEFDYENPSKIRSFIDDIDKLIHGNKDVTVTDIFEGGFEAVGDGLKHITTAVAELTLITAGIDKIADNIKQKEMIKDDSDPKKQEMLKNVTELTSKMTKVNGIITATAASVSTLVEFCSNIFGIGASIKGTKENATREIDEAIDSFITDEMRTANPKKDGESDEAYQNRLRAEVCKNHSDKEIFARKAEIKKEREKTQHDAAKEEYKRKKEEARNNNDSSDDEEGDNGSSPSVEEDTTSSTDTSTASETKPEVPKPEAPKNEPPQPEVPKSEPRNNSKQELTAAQKCDIKPITKPISMHEMFDKVRSLEGGVNTEYYKQLHNVDHVMRVNSMESNTDRLYILDNGVQTKGRYGTGYLYPNHTEPFKGVYITPTLFEIDGLSGKDTIREDSPFKIIPAVIWENYIIHKGKIWKEG